MKFSSAFLFAIAAVSVHAEGPKPRPVPLGACDFNNDCDDDDHCGSGLLCADDHKKELKEKGYDTRTANCGPRTDGLVWEVCFDARILYNSSGFGGKSIASFNFDDILILA